MRTDTPTVPDPTLDYLVASYAVADGLSPFRAARALSAINDYVATVRRQAYQECEKIAAKHYCPAHPLGIGIPDAIITDIKALYSTPTAGEPR
jgi:hypothetical protein